MKISIIPGSVYAAVYTALNYVFRTHSRVSHVSPFIFRRYTKLQIHFRKQREAKVIIKRRLRGYSRADERFPLIFRSRSNEKEREEEREIYIE